MEEGRKGEGRGGEERREEERKGEERRGEERRGGEEERKGRKEEGGGEEGRFQTKHLKGVSLPNANSCIYKHNAHCHILTAHYTSSPQSR